MCDFETLHFFLVRNVRSLKFISETLCTHLSNVETRQQGQINGPHYEDNLRFMGKS